MNNLNKWKDYPVERDIWTKDLAIQKIDSYDNIYQSIELDEGVILGHPNGSLGKKKWDSLIGKHVPSDMSGLRILDVACNAGVFCIECCRRCAVEVIGVDRSPEHHDQARFIKSYLEWKEKRKYPIKYININMWEFFEKNTEKFDIVFACNIVYHMRKKRVELLKMIRPITDKIIVTGNKNADFGTTSSLKTAILNGGFRILEINDHDNSSSPLIVGKPVGNFRFKILSVSLKNIKNNDKYISEMPQVSFLKSYMQNSDFDITKTDLYKKLLTDRVRLWYKNDNLGETVGRLIYLTEWYCNNLIELFELIKKNGYLSGEYSYSYIPVLKLKENYSLIEGIHRATILLALGYDEVKVCELFEDERIEWNSCVNGTKLANEIKRMEGINE